MLFRDFSGFHVSFRLCDAICTMQRPQCKCISGNIKLYMSHLVWMHPSTEHANVPDFPGALSATQTRPGSRHSKRCKCPVQLHHRTHRDDAMGFFSGGWRSAEWCASVFKKKKMHDCAWFAGVVVSCFVCFFVGGDFDHQQHQNHQKHPCLVRMSFFGQQLACGTGADSPATGKATSPSFSGTVVSACRKKTQGSLHCDHKIYL